MNLLVGYTGLVPFGASVFFGCASYAVAIPMRSFLGNEVLALIFAVVFSLVLATVIAVIILRRRGLYFSLLTLAFSQIAFEIAFKWTDLTGGENALRHVPRPWFTSDFTFHVVTVAIVTLGMYRLWRLAHAPFGRVLYQRPKLMTRPSFWAVGMAHRVGGQRRRQDHDAARDHRNDPENHGKDHHRRPRHHDRADL